ncbi:MAG: Rossmann-like and DUF2520 domain-containing protein, partial [Planctomycetota bacterium]
VAHCSGALGSDALSSAKKAGCLVGSLHPLQTFPSAESAVERWAGVYCFCEGDEAILDVLMELARSVGARPAALKPDGKALYHAAAVVAGNYVTTLLDAACQMWRQAGIDDQTAQSALSHLAATTAENASTMDLAQSLTGPIARGDVGTVRKHIQAIAGMPVQLQHLYRCAGIRTIDIALRKGSIDEDTANQLRDTLDP